MAVLANETAEESVMDKKFSFDLQWISSESCRNNPIDRFHIDALCAIAERLEAIYEVLEWTRTEKRDRSVKA